MQDITGCVEAQLASLQRPSKLTLSQLYSQQKQPQQHDGAVYLVGRPGTAKTHTVRAVLEKEIQEPYVYQSGQLTPIGLFELIAELRLQRGSRQRLRQRRYRRADMERYAPWSYSMDYTTVGTMEFHAVKWG